MADISKINAVLIANIAEIDDVLAANIAKVNGLVFSIAPGVQFLLDTYTGAGAAFSTRRLATATTVLLRVRRDTAGGTGDDDEADVAYDSNDELSLDSAISNASAGVTATTLGEFINVGTVGGTTYSNPDSLTVTASCYLPSWYDQSTRGNDFEQSTHSAQPQIHDGTTDQDLERENGKVCLDVTTAQEMSVSSVSWSNAAARGDAYCVVKLTTISSGSLTSGAIYGMGSNIQNSLLVNTVSGRGTRLRPLSSSLFDGPNVTTGTNYLTYHRSGGSYTTGVSLASAINGGSIVGGNAGINWAGMKLNLDNVTEYRINELVVFNPPSDTDRTGIEGNLNAHYQIGNFGTPTSGLLYDYSGAAAAYSVRQLANTAALAMRIREDGTDTETDIGFDANGDLDTAAISSHCGSNNGFVVTWYDQSGNQNDAAQGTSGSQPQIYNGSAVITNNGVSALQFDSSGTNPMYFTAVTSSEYVVAVCGIDGNTWNVLLSLDTPTTNRDSSHRVYQNKWRLNGAPPSDWYEESQGDAYINGSQVTGTPATASQQLFLAWNTDPDPLYGFSSISTVKNSRGWYGKIQEIIIYENTNYSDSTNRSGIETNINSEYLIYQPTDAPTSGLLATYTGAAAAYSVRQLSDKAVIAMRIRRDSDDAETNIGFDSNGDLDTTAISDFCSTANGYVVEWADQSTNGNHASQSTGTSQPQIYNGTAVITENGKPALKADSGSTNLGLETTLNPDYQQEAWFFGVLKITGNSIPVATTNNKYFALSQSGGTGGTQSGFTNLTYYSDGTALSSPTSGDLYDELTTQSLLTVDHEWASTDETPFYEVGGYGFFSRNIFQEYIIWQTSQSTNRNGIETNINNYFSIY